MGIPVSQPIGRGAAFVGCYLPRACGIATFTTDLAESSARCANMHQTISAVAMDDEAEEYAWPKRVRFSIRQECFADYERAARFLNELPIDAVSIQHEYGIFGGEDGSYVLSLMRHLNRPIVVTCHTIRKRPTRAQREIMIEMAARARRLVVMNRLGEEFLVSRYRIPREKIVLIPHGIHELPFRDARRTGELFGVDGRVLLTFGLLHSKKGIEYMIEALPRILDKHPDVTYIVLGRTHPKIAMMEGEGYRMGLERLVERLGIGSAVRFIPRFLTLHELLEYLAATDIFITPYVTREYITSGALAYAVGSGTAVVSTPYWYASELLADGRGCLVPMRSARALARTVIRLLDDEVLLENIRRKAYAFSRPMVWTNVARAYLRLFTEVSAPAVRRPVRMLPASRDPAPVILPPQ